MSWYYPLRRLPQAAKPGLLPQKTLFLWPGLAESVGLTLLAEGFRLLPRGWPGIPKLQEILQEQAKKRGNELRERAQRVYFENPGLDTLTVRALTKVGLRIASLGRTYLATRILLGLDRDGRAASALPLLPRTGYDALMVSGLAVGTALGFFFGGKVRHYLWWDSKLEQEGQPQPSLPPGHPRPGVRRFAPPRTLTDLAADIDDLYWAEAHGQAIKVTRVGEGATRRWLVSVPGTDHFDPITTVNVADMESNLREELNLPSAMRLGVVKAIRAAMSQEGLSAAAKIREKVLICGHSQGGMIAVALASMDPAELGFTVDAVITEGAPARRLKVRPEVAILSLEHDQDIVPALDGAPRIQKDQRVIYRRSLVMPRMGSLFYAHSSTTYTETLRRFERQQTVALWGAARQVGSRLRAYLPKAGEEWRVTHHYVWQEILAPSRSNTWDQYVSISSTDEPAFSSTIQFEGEPVLPETTPIEPLTARAGKGGQKTNEARKEADSGAAFGFGGSKASFSIDGSAGRSGVASSVAGNRVASSLAASVEGSGRQGERQQREQQGGESDE